MRGKLRVLGNVPTQCKGEAWCRGHIRKGRVKWVWEGYSWVLPQREKVLFQTLENISILCWCLLPAFLRRWRAQLLPRAGGAALCDLGSSEREGAVQCLTVQERGLTDNICLPALRLNLMGSLLHSYPLPGIDPWVRCDLRLPLTRAGPAPSTTT